MCSRASYVIVTRGSELSTIQISIALDYGRSAARDYVSYTCRLWDSSGLGNARRFASSNCLGIGRTSELDVAPMDGVLKGLNKAQLEAVTSTASVLQVLAPPGSGKTKTLTARVAHLVVEQQLQPWNIVVCTFTVKAAKEMKERIKTVVGEALAKKLLLGTFHSVALRYLRHYGHHVGIPKDFGVADSSDSRAILKRIIKQLKLSIEPGHALGRISARKVKGSTNAEPAKSGNNVEQQEFAKVFDEYEATLAASNLLDYDDLLLRCCFLLRTHPQCVSNIQSVLIDEFQDTNTVQYDLMSLFAQKQNVITIVGDPDQSIYGFRAAEIKNLARMKMQWPDTLTINLEENYRSSAAILHAAQKIIEQDESRPQKKLQATHGFGLRPVLRKLPSAMAEGEWLVSELKRIQAMSGNMLQASDFAILLRSSALSRAIEAALGNEGVPYRMVGGLRFYDRYEVKLVVDYLRVIHNPGNTEAVERILNVPSRKIGDETLKSLREEAKTKGVPLWDLIRDIAQGRTSTKCRLLQPARKGLEVFVNVILSGRKKIAVEDSSDISVVDLITLVSQKISLQEHLKAKDGDDKKAYEARWANVEELMAQAQDLTSSGKIEEIIQADSLPTVDGLEQNGPAVEDILSMFLANIALASATEQKSEDEGERVHQVTISTIHAAKGLEWPVVFVPACYEGSIPHSRADDNDEERRLLYVAMTRAQALLYLSCPVENSRKEDTTLSTFLTQPGVDQFFEQHGPSLPADAIMSLSQTLRRSCPDGEALAKGKKSIPRDEDNHWPLTGEEPLGDTAKWQPSKTYSGYSSAGSMRSAGWVQTATSMQQARGFSTASATMKSGFTSAKARYDEVRQEQEQLRQIDKRVTDQRKKEEAPKGKKRQMQDNASISSFFVNKRPKPVEVVEPEQDSRSVVSRIDGSASFPLNDVSNTAPQANHERTTISLHRPRTAPLGRLPMTKIASEGVENDSRYVFLSSSPTREPAAPTAVPVKPLSVNAAPPLGTNGFRPASTLHATSMSALGAQRKTYGLKRSLNGWPPKPRPQP